MTRETKIGLLIGLGMFLLIAIVISDQVATPNPDGLDMLRNLAGSEPIADAQPPAPTPATVTAAAPRPTGQPPIPRFNPATAPPGSSAASPTQAATPPAVDVTPQPARPETRLTAPSLRRTPPAAPGAAQQIHHVQEGENLSEIAERFYGRSARWSLIRDANPGVVGADGQVRSGVRLVIPPLREQPSAPQQVVDAVRRVTQTPDAADPPAPRDDATQHYRVRPGDTLSLIADVELGSRDRWREIYELNRDRIENPDMLVEGDRLRLPR